MMKMVNMSRRQFLKLSATTGGGLVVAACTPQATQAPSGGEEPSASAEPVAEAIMLEIADWQGGQRNYYSAYDRAIALFEEANSNIKVSRRAMGFAEYGKAVQPILASGDLPDIMGLYQGPDMFSGIDAGLVINLGPILAADSEWGSRLAKSMAGFDDFHKDGAPYAVPLDVITIVLAYHKDLASARGLTVDKLINIDDFKAAGLLMAQDELYLANYVDTIASITVAIAQQTGDSSLSIVRQAERGEVSWTEDVFLNAWKSWEVMLSVKQGLAPPDLASGIEVEAGLYDQRWWGLWYAGEWLAGEFQRNMPDTLGQVGITNFPSRPGASAPNIWSGGPGQILSVADKDHKEQALAFLKHLSSPAVVEIFIEESIHPPVNFPTASAHNDNPFFLTLLDQFNEADALVGFSILNADIVNRMKEHGGNLMLGAVTPEEIGADLDTISGFTS